MQVLWLPSSTAPLKALNPSAVFRTPVVIPSPALEPITVFCIPVVIALPVSEPIAVLELVVLEVKFCASRAE